MKTKSILLALVVLFICMENKAQERVKYFEGSFEEALKEAQKQEKPLFIKTYTDWCYYCKKMDKKTMVDKEVVNMLNDNFIVLSFNMEEEPGLELNKKFKVEAYPTMLILGTDGKQVARLVGYHKPEELQPKLAKILAI